VNKQFVAASISMLEIEAKVPLDDDPCRELHVGGFFRPHTAIPS
jgi:hypothetical protein